MDPITTTASVRIDAGSPWFSGHFPDDPILPGIAQLKMVADLLGRTTAARVDVLGLSRIKFRKIVRPGEQLDIEVSCTPQSDQCQFKITCGDQEVCSGRMTVSPPATPE
ncbi:3-hydroxyacyl-ACP dehydratase FabZ family protein [Desulfogranum mediterraneum]|uniref:3-hydroxyacyl-ACP dehydratase FabZ family protein n=1 Tax=Desulfogranum mediterraneum TaxID=160661 RepID=UPI00048FFBD5|nr:hypothetical protein [Desulfogranum mediterraneum]